MRLSRVLDLTNEHVREALGVETEELTQENSVVAREIGEAANYLGFEAIVAPSAAGSGFVIAILLNNRAAESEILVPAAGEE